MAGGGVILPMLRRRFRSIGSGIYRTSRLAAGGNDTVPMKIRYRRDEDAVD
jgi:hypothetical protein